MENETFTRVYRQFYINQKEFDKKRAGNNILGYFRKCQTNIEYRIIMNLPNKLFSHHPVTVQLVIVLFYYMVNLWGNNFSLCLKTQKTLAIFAKIQLHKTLIN